MARRTKMHTTRTLLILFLTGMLSLHLLLAWDASDLVRKGYPDFTIFYSAGKIVRQGLGTKLYDEETQYRVQQEFASGVSIRQGPLPYNHPPFEALIFVPLTLLPYFAAFLLWDLMNLGILLALPFLLRRHIPLLQRIPIVGWLLVSLAFFPVFIALLQGQDILLLLLLFTLAFVSLKRNADFAAGCWLGLGIFRFHLVVPFLLILLLRKRHKAILGFLLVALALGGISIVVVGWRETLAYPGYVWHLEQTMGHRRTIVPGLMPNARGLLDSLLTPNTSTVFRDIVSVLVSVILMCFAAWEWRATSIAAFDLGFSLCVIVTVLVGYHAFAYDLSLLILPIALVANHVLESNPLGDWRGIALFGPLFLLFFTPLQMFLYLRNGHYNLMALVLLFWGWGVAREISRLPLVSPTEPPVLQHT
jgi:alpha-1,2-mannosyltransferase